MWVHWGVHSGECEMWLHWGVQSGQWERGIMKEISLLTKPRLLKPVNLSSFQLTGRRVVTK